MDTLTRYFGSRRAITISRADVDAFVAKRTGPTAAGGDGMSRGTVARDLATLTRGFRLAMESGLLSRAPKLPTLKAGVRRGFVTEAQYRVLHAELPDPYGDMLTVGFALGWRRGELLRLRWDQVDLPHAMVRLEPGTTKNDEGREVYLSDFPELVALLQRRHAAARALGTPWVFWRPGGKPVSASAFGRAWRMAREQVAADLRPHDLRRTAVRNLERAGVPRSVATKITGHKSEAVYRRYAIATPADTRPALGKVAALIGYTLGVAATVKQALTEEPGRPSRAQLRAQSAARPSSRREKIRAYAAQPVSV